MVAASFAMAAYGGFTRWRERRELAQRAMTRCASDYMLEHPDVPPGAIVWLDRANGQWWARREGEEPVRLDESRSEGKKKGYQTRP